MTSGLVLKEARARVDQTFSTLLRNKLHSLFLYFALLFSFVTLHLRYTFVLRFWAAFM